MPHANKPSSSTPNLHSHDHPGALCVHPQARGLAWRFFLGALPCSSDADEAACLRLLQAQREQYAQWKEQLYPDFNKARLTYQTRLSPELCVVLLNCS